MESAATTHVAENWGWHMLPRAIPLPGIWVAPVAVPVFSCAPQHSYLKHENPK